MKTDFRGTRMGAINSCTDRLKALKIEYTATVLGGSAPSALTKLRQGQHACLVYDDLQTVVRSVAPFVAVGLAGNERCVYVTGDHDPVHIRSALSAEGIDVARHERSGALVLVDRWEVSFPGGTFDPEAMIRYVRQSIDDATASGFAGLRVVAEMTWALQMGVGHNKLIHYEALGNALYPDQPLVAACLYDRRKFPVEVCHDALRVHPYVAIDDLTYRNIYFEPPEHGEAAPAEASQRVEEMLQLLRDLHAAEQARTALLREQSARAESEAALRAKDELLALLGHELRNPLSTMMAAIRTGKVRLESGAGDSFRTLFDILERQVTKQTKLVEQVLDAARMSAGQLPVQPRRCDLSGLIANAVEQTRITAPDRQFVLRSASALQIHADPARMDQVLMNLLDNAVKFSPPGSSIDIDTEHNEAGYIDVVVRDRGLGLTPGECERVFDRYYQGKSSLGGLGLGLHLCREIMRRHGGELFADPETDDGEGGARFVARIPVVRQPRRRTRPASAAGDHRSRASE